MLRELYDGVLRVETNSGPPRPIVGRVPDPEDVQWLGELYNRYSDAVRDVILRLGGPSIDAEDLVHEVFLAAHRKISLLRSYDEIGGWFYLAALREVWRVRRRIRRWRFLSLGLANRRRERSLDSADFKRAEVAEWVYAILDKLPARQREALILFHLQGLTSVEIGKLLGCPEETVRARIFHGKRAFVRAVKREQTREGRSLGGLR
jgi:RNA polymerase sigma-70 factor (ECF subfamily)